MKMTTKLLRTPQVTLDYAQMIEFKTDGYQPNYRSKDYVQLDGSLKIVFNNGGEDYDKWREAATSGRQIRITIEIDDAE